MVVYAIHNAQGRHSTVGPTVCSPNQLGEAVSNQAESTTTESAVHINHVAQHSLGGAPTLLLAPYALQDPARSLRQNCQSRLPEQAVLGKSPRCDNQRCA